MSSIIDLSSEFLGGMYIWFGEEQSNLKQKVPKSKQHATNKIRSRVIEGIRKIEGVSKQKVD